VTTFAAAMEAYRDGARLDDCRSLPLEGAAPGEATAMCVGSYEPADTHRTDIILSSLNPNVTCRTRIWDQEISFQGRFGLIVTHGWKLTSMTLAGGGHISYGDRRLEAPPNFRGRITGTESEQDAIIVSVDAEAPGPELVGRKVIISGEDYVCPAVYTIEAVQPAGEGAWRLKLNMPLLVARGVVGSVEGGAFSSRTPVMKLRVNPGLFNGKVIRSSPEAAEARLNTAREGAFTLADPGRTGEFTAGGEYFVYDIGIGDSVEVVSEASMEL